MAGKMKIVDRTGHTTLEWPDTDAPVEDGQLSQAEVNSRFDELVQANFVAFKKEAPDKGFEMARGEGFDPEAHEYLMVPPMAGGR